MKAQAASNRGSGGQGHWQLTSRLKLSPAVSVWPGEVQASTGAEAEPGSEWPGLSLGFCLTPPPLRLGGAGRGAK